MAILSLPSSPGFASSEFRLLSNTRSFTSAEDGSTETEEKSGSHWLWEAMLPVMAEANGRIWTAFFVSLDGTAGRFYAGDPAGATSRGSASDPTGTPIVKGASQTGKSLITDGWGLNETNVLLKGDYIAFDLPSTGRSLHQVTADASSDGVGTGEATLTIHPALRESPANNATIIVDDTTCVMMLLDDNQARWSVDTAGFYHIAFTAIEAFNTG